MMICADQDGQWRFRLSPLPTRSFTDLGTPCSEFELELSPPSSLSRTCGQRRAKTEGPDLGLDARLSRELLIAAAFPLEHGFRSPVEPHGGRFLGKPLLIWLVGSIRHLLPETPTWIHQCGWEMQKIDVRPWGVNTPNQLVVHLRRNDSSHLLIDNSVPISIHCRENLAQTYRTSAG
jgi:hypothetical protein